MNRDEGSYTLSHMYDHFFHVTSLSWQEPEEELNKLFLIKVSDGRDRNIKVKCLVVLR